MVNGRTTARSFALAVLIGLLAALSGRVQAAGASQLADDWQTQQTRYFIILYHPGDAGEASVYTSFGDPIYETLTAAFNVRLDTPVRIRLYSTEDEYFVANPFAAHVQGVIADADAIRREVGVILPRTESMPLALKENNVRHELTHLIAAQLSDDRLPPGWQEGLAQYAEQPGPDLEQAAALLDSARASDNLLPWSGLSDRSQVYADPQISYPESRSIIAYLVDRFGFDRLLTFIATFAQQPGYRSALETTYGQSADALEADWHDHYLASYVNGGWKVSALYAYDLSTAEELLAQGSYSAAIAELEQALRVLRTTNQPAVLAKAQAWLARGQRGQQAHQLADQARAALEASDYDQALKLARQAQGIFQELQDTRRQAELNLYIQRATMGQQARETLREAGQMVDTWQIPGAHQKINQAASLFAQLNDTAGLAQSQALLNRILDTRRLAVLGLFGGAGVLGLWNGLRRLADARRRHEYPESGLI